MSEQSKDEMYESNMELITDLTFQHEGKGFTHTVKFEKDTHAFADTAEYDFKRALKRFRCVPPEVTVTSSHKKNLFTKSFCGEINVHVPDSYAIELFRQKFSNEAYPFRDYLLANYYPLIKKYAKRIFDSICMTFYVAAGGIRFEYSDDYDIRFYDDGMGDIGYPGQSYGMALAVLTVLKKEFADKPSSSGLDYSSYYITIRGGYSFPFKKQQKKPVKSW